MSKNNIDIIKENISRIMKEKGMTQSELSEKTGISQPRISAALAPGNSKCFTAEQIVTLASKDVFNCTTDEILLPSTKGQVNEIETVSDIWEMLFKIDEVVNLGIGEYDVNRYQSVFSFFFPSEEAQGVLSEWKQLKEIDLEPPFKDKIIRQWKEEVLEAYKDFEKKIFLKPLRNMNEDDDELPFY